MRIKEYSLLENNGFGGILSYHSVLSPRKRQYNEHHHTECELSVFLSGTGSYRVKDKIYSFSAGDVFLFGSNEVHCITEISESIDLLNIRFEPYLLWGNPDATPLLGLFTSRSPSFENRIEDPEGEIRELILALEDELSTQRPCNTVAAKYSLFMLLTKIIRKSSGIKEYKDISTSLETAKSLRAAMDYIGENLSSRLTLGEIADAACLSPTYFSSVFKKFNGISPWEYISIKRVEMAIEMLKNTNLTKLEISERCGFSSSSNFYKTFVRLTGKKPGEYTK